MGQDCVAISKRQPEIFAATTRLRKGAPGRLQLKVCRPRQMSTHRARMEYPYAKDPASSDAVGQTAPYHLDFGKLGHALGVSEWGSDRSRDCPSARRKP